MDDSLYIAVDLGAGSGRVFLAGVGPQEVWFEEVRRFHYPPRRRAGHLRWDWSHIFAEIKAGLRTAGERARQLGRSVSSIGVDSWGVDYGLIDRDGEVIEDPICYRDERTADMIEAFCARGSRTELYARTGIQLLNFNTIFQLCAHQRAGIPQTATRLLLIPDLIHFLLTGRAVTEYTNATTTQLINAETGAWDRRLLGLLDLPEHLFADLIVPGTRIGPLKAALAAELQLDGVSVIAPATHDTASAVIGAPLTDDRAYISSGTWSLVGVERNSPLINAEAARHNFTNEGGAFGTIRFLKNVCGLWLLESCRKEWQAQGVAVDYDSLLAEVAAIEADTGLIFPDDLRFFNPPSMLDAIAAQMAETNQPCSNEPAVIARVILDSLALRYASVLRTIEELTGRKVEGVQIVGGGSQNDYLNQATATATGKPVLAGPVEATVIGNVLVQAIAAGRFASLKDARRHVTEYTRLKKFTPGASKRWQAQARRYAAIEARYVN
ncbi:MAG TPA: rhamnulokinase family protein [Blastocatellia bacterium]|nr:rhamnulokinase family protein [Blastocatellia bacterium]